MKSKIKLVFMVVRLIMLNILLFVNCIKADRVKPLFTLNVNLNYNYLLTEQGVRIDSSYANVILVFQSQNENAIKLKYSEIYDVNLIYDETGINDNSYHDILVETKTGEIFDVFDLAYCKKDGLKISGHQPFTNRKDLYYQVNSVNLNNNGVFRLPAPINMEMMRQCYTNEEIRFVVKGSLLLDDGEEKGFKIRSNWLTIP